jgi:hypothetical protein
MRKGNQPANVSPDLLDALVRQRDVYQLVGQRQERLESKLDATRALLAEFLTKVMRAIEEVAMKVEQNRQYLDELKAFQRRQMETQLSQ